MTKRRNTTPVPPAPGDLSPESSALWPGLAADVAVAMGGGQVDFLALAGVLRAADRLAEIRAVLAAEGLTVKGSKGQSRPHPLLIAESVLRREVAQGMKSLRLSAADRHRFDVGDDGRLQRDRIYNDF
jgi:hypothetical protein